MSGEAGEELDTPAARIMARRESRAAMPDRLKVAAPDDSSDEEWNGDDDEDEEEEVAFTWTRRSVAACACTRCKELRGRPPEWGWTTTAQEPREDAGVHFAICATSCCAPQLAFSTRRAQSIRYIQPTPCSRMSRWSTRRRLAVLHPTLRANRRVGR